MKIFKAAVLGLLVLVMVPGLGFAEEPLEDPFYSKWSGGGGPSSDGPNVRGAVEEQVDPFSGHLRLVHTDLFIPGNNGLDLKIVRYYDSSIWARTDPNLLHSFIKTREEISPLGIGWNMHMGIVRNPYGSGSYNHASPDNPVFVLQDGSTQVFYKDKNDGSRLMHSQKVKIR